MIDASRKVGAVVVVAVAALAFDVPSARAETDVVPDPGFRGCLNSAVALQANVARAADMPIESEDLAAVTDVLCEGDGGEDGQLVIESIEGAQYLTDAMSLTVYSSPVSDVSPLADLSGLVSLSLSYTEVSDISPLAGLVSLQELHLTGSPVTDVSALAELGALRHLDVSVAKVSDISVLEELPAVARDGVCDGGVCWTFSAGQQRVELDATTGTSPIPIEGLSDDPVTVEVVHGPATVDNEAGTITYTGVGAVEFSWAGKKVNDYGPVFSGTAKVAVTRAPSPSGEPEGRATQPASAPGSVSAATDGSDVGAGGAVVGPGLGSLGVAVALAVAASAAILRRASRRGASRW